MEEKENAAVRREFISRDFSAIPSYSDTMENRYARQVDLFTEEVWSRLASLKIVVAGCGGLGTHVLDLLCRMGPLTLEIWDPGRVDEPDLNRQLLYTPAELGMLKTEAASSRIRAINPEVTITARPERINEHSQLGGSSGDFDLCFDCLDTFSARADLEKALVHAPSRQKCERPLIHGGVSGFFGQIAILFPPRRGYGDIFGSEFADIPQGSQQIFPPVVAQTAAQQVSLLFQWLAHPETIGEGEVSFSDSQHNGHTKRIIPHSK